VTLLRVLAGDGLRAAARRTLPLVAVLALAVAGLAGCHAAAWGTPPRGRSSPGGVDGLLHQLTLDGARTGALSDAVVLDHGDLILSIETRPGRPLYFSDAGAIYELRL
jgi:hypothetical protein